MRFLDFMSTRPGRMIRAALGLLLMAIGALLGGAWWILAIAGLLPLGTGLLNLCPISPLFARSCRGNACRAVPDYTALDYTALDHTAPE